MSRYKVIYEDSLGQYNSVEVNSNSKKEAAEKIKKDNGLNKERIVDVSKSR